MGMLLRFNPRAAPPAGTPPARRGPATVILFTGVRYERGAARPARDKRRKG